MRILMQSRSNLLTSPGGDTIQVQKTAEELSKLGIKVDIDVKNRSEEFYKSYDLVHLFNITLASENWLSLRTCKRLKIPVAVSTIYYPPADIKCFEKFNTFGLAGKFLKLMSSVGLSWKSKEVHHLLKTGNFGILAKTAFVSYNSLIKELIFGADTLLPNSIMEKEEIIYNFGVDKDRFHIVPNAVEIDEVSYDHRKIKEQFPWLNNFKKWVIVPGRIEPFKNQLSVIEALAEIDAGIIFTGTLSGTYRDYIEQFVSAVEKGGRFYYLGFVDKKTLNSLFSIVDVVLLPSWSETTGLVGLEGAVNNCQVVITERGYTREYYQDYAYYCAPDNVASIRDAVYRALESPKDLSPLIDKIKKRYTWECAAKETLNAYKAVLNKKIPTS